MNHDQLILFATLEVEMFRMANDKLRRYDVLKAKAPGLFVPEVRELGELQDALDAYQEFPPVAWWRQVGWLQ